MSYILSRGNRFYAAVENKYGFVAPVSASNRVIARELRAHQVTAPSVRRDKTGLRTYAASGIQGLKTTAFEMKTVFTSSSTAPTPNFDPLLQSALGGAVRIFSGIVVAGMQSQSEIATASPHGMPVGAAVAYAGEIRFVTAVPDSSTLVVNAPFSNSIAPGSDVWPTACYSLGTSLASVSLYDYWDPAGAVSRLLNGALVNQLQVSITGSEADLAFTGPSAELIDSSTFVQGTGGLSAYPFEPALTDFEYSTVSTQLGQAWLGNSTQRFYSLLDASIAVNNNLQLRQHDVSPAGAKAFAPGPREITVDFAIFAQDDAQTAALYAIAKQRGTVSVQIQVGSTPGQIMSVYVPAVTPEMPIFDDKSERLQWQFSKCVARGVSNDEVYFAFA